MEAAGRIAPQPWMVAAETRAVMAALSADGGEALFVGGCVRDAILGRPVTDIDIATGAPPETVTERLEAAGIRVVPTGIKHGTVTAVTGKAHFEITSLRVDVRSFGRHADVAFTDDWSADAARRDFTMNAVFCAPDGTLYDAFGGIADIRAGRVRFVGDARQRIREDVLRLLRFFRFYANYGRPPPDAEALAACRELAPLLPTLSAERVWSELRKLLLAPDPAPVVRLMDADGVSDHVLPAARDPARLAALTGLEAKLAEADALRRLAALVVVDAGEAEALAASLRLSRAETDRLVAIAGALAKFAPVADAVARRRWFYRLGGALYRDLLLLHWAGQKAGGARVSGARARAYQEAMAEAARWKKPRFPIAGQDVVNLGVEPGPGVGALLEDVERWWIEGDFQAGRKACLARLKAAAAGRRP